MEKRAVTATYNFALPYVQRYFAWKAPVFWQFMSVWFSPWEDDRQRGISPWWHRLWGTRSLSGISGQPGNTKWKHGREEKTYRENYWSDKRKYLFIIIWQKALLPGKISWSCLIFYRSMFSTHWEDCEYKCWGWQTSESMWQLESYQMLPVQWVNSWSSSSSGAWIMRSE